MTETRPMKDRRKRRAWLAVLTAVSLVSLVSSCIIENKGDDDDEPESTYGWSWEAGSDSVAQPGVYGTKGTAAAANWPGARGYHHLLYDPSGTLWL